MNGSLDGDNQYHVEEVHICETTKFQKVGMLSNKLKAVKLIFAKFRNTFSAPLYRSGIVFAECSPSWYSVLAVGSVPFRSGCCGEKTPGTVHGMQRHELTTSPPGRVPPPLSTNRHF